MRGHLTWERRHAGSPWSSARKDYEAAHIPGSVYLDFTTDLVDLDDPVPLQVAPFGKLQSIFADSGIGDEHTVVAYDADRSIFATRLWWIFRLCGHSNVRVLNGGWDKWRREGRPMSAEQPNHPPAQFTVNPQPVCRTGIEVLHDSLGSAHLALVDARSIEDFSGNPKWASRGGHIPGAVNLPASSFLRGDGTFRPIPELRSMVESLAPGRKVVTYCGLGLAATAVAFVLDMLGFQEVSVFDGSWAEWGSRSELPYA